MYDIFSDLRAIPGIGDETYCKIIKIINGTRIIDLLLYIPSNYSSVKNNSDFFQLKDNTDVIIPLRIIKKQTGRLHFGRGKSIKIKAINDQNNTEIELIFFKIAQSFYDKLIEGKTFVMNGKLRIKNNKYSIVHPSILAKNQHIDSVKTVNRIKTEQINDTKDYSKNELSVNQSINNDPLFPVYSTNESLSSNTIYNLIKIAFKVINRGNNIKLSQELSSLFEEGATIDLIEALYKLHNPSSFADIEDNSIYRDTLAIYEIIASQYSLLLSRKSIIETNGIKINCHNQLIDKVINGLDFTLTEDQRKCVNEITEDQRSSKKMIRLLQGDVGSGKTIVAILAMLNVIESGSCAVLLAPTSVLVLQHYDTIRKFCLKLNLTIEYITSNIKNAKRDLMVKKLKNKEIDIIIGTHALFYDKIEFYNVGLFVIDEQHSFGVQQRINLINKSSTTDLLMMSATPIPRTLTMVMYGDIAVSKLIVKPKGRQSIKTSIISMSKYEELISGINRTILTGNKVFWVCPLIEKSDKKTDINDVTSRAKDLEKRFGINNVGVVHGKMNNDEKDATIKKFKDGEFKILVSTTVIEVGIDIKDATVIIIEHANLFGLTQLHQLRGRVGRGNKLSYCVLLHDEKISLNAAKRLNIIKNSNDGFFIAEQDFKMRGGGKILGIEQSGFRQFRFVDLSRHYSVIKKISNNVINNSETSTLNYLMKIFQYDSNSPESFVTV